MAEQWKDIPGFEDAYQVSNLGRVRGLDRLVVHSNGRTQFVAGRVLKPTPMSQGYPTVKLYRDGTPSTKFVHELVAEAFVGPRPDGHWVNHIDGDKTNNRADNLEFVTPSENMRHAVEIGLYEPVRGEAHPSAKLTREQVKAIRELYATGWVFLSELAENFGVAPTTVRAVVNRERWVHVD